ncbi:protein-lysine N-methyltransferase EEF2KMT [Biomphalaria pfeifferi]|uniref:Protein-lysine N-methyltransferase EEF2KMT n=1 Tax=Biomphalaria pfeifferi TaxID=112525 RepID=A0AAD8F3P3_BIOPF|nr:protein-lysine N-methyltransferase EEF2KMT [Biomphalaria pfeifferi]
MVPVRKMKWKDDEAALLLSNPELQKHLLLATVKHPVCVKFPPSLSYMRSFMKLLIYKLESEDANICDEMYEAYTDLLSGSEEDDETLCYKSYRMPSGDCISLRESVHLVSQGTTGLSTWQAAQHLAEWVLENSQTFTNKCVTELGSGLGLTGIITCKSCQVQSYAFTDCHAQVLYLLSKNIELNLLYSSSSSTLDSGSTDRDKKIIRKIRKQLSLSSEPQGSAVSDNEWGENSQTDDSLSMQLEDINDDGIYSDPVELDVNASVWDVDSSHRLATFKSDKRISISHLDWECVKGKILEKLKSDIILAADVVYDTSIIPSLVYVLKILLDPGSNSNKKPQAYIASTIRNEDTRDAFLIAIGNEGLNYMVVESPKQQRFHYDRSVPIEILQVSA